MFRQPFLWYFSLSIFFVSCSTADPEISPIDFLKEGDRLTRLTSDTLSKTMQIALENGDYEKAIQLCKAMAPTLTGTYNNKATSIRRTAIRVRNATNSPSELEAPQLDFYQKLVDEKGPLKAKLVLDEKGIVHYFKPIILQPHCLKCHGSEASDILPETLAMIKKEYPLDVATGYASGDLRGLWHITFNPFNKQSK